MLFTLTGVDLHCSFQLEGGEVLRDAARLVLDKSADDPKFAEMLEKVVLPAGFALLNAKLGCICLTLQAENLSALKELWERHESGCLQKSLQELLVTDEIKRMAEGKEVELKVNVDQDSYRNAYLDLFIAEKEGGLD